MIANESDAISALIEYALIALNNGKQAEYDYLRSLLVSNDPKKALADLPLNYAMCLYQKV